MILSQNKKESFKFVIQEFQSEVLPETIERELEVPLFAKKVIAIYGPRRCGKSFYCYTLIKKLINNGIENERIVYINFEDDRLLPLNFKDLGAFIEAYFELYPENKGKETFFFFDEIQNIDNWEIFVRRFYDKEKVKIFITGSSSKLLSKEIATSLRGRSLSFALYPLSFKEFLNFKKLKLEKNFEYSPQRFKIKKLLEEYLEYGGFPEVALEDNVQLKRKNLEEYFNSLVYRDLVERHSLANTPLLKELLKFLFTNATSLFSVYSYYKTIKQTLSVSRETISNYLSYIMETEYFFLLSKFSYSLKEQRVNPKKIISLDNGLKNRIAFRFSQEEGKNAENLVGNMLIRYEKEIYYWQNSREVDFVIKDGHRLTGVNVTFGREINTREIDSLWEFKRKFKNVKELILITKDTEERKRGVILLPLWKWLLK